MKILILILVIPFVISAACSEPKNNSGAESMTNEKIEFYKNKVEIDPRAYTYHNRLAQVYIEMARETGDHDYYHKAELELRKSLRISPNNYIGLVYMAMAQASEHNFKKALKFAQRAVKVNPNRSYAYGVLGDAYLELGQLQNAEKSYKYMIELKPGLDSYSRLSNLRFKRHEITGAINAMEKAYEYGLKNVRTPKVNLAWTQAMLGSIYLHEGDKDQAETYFDRALEIMPDFAIARGFVKESHTHSF